MFNQFKKNNIIQELIPGKNDCRIWVLEFQKREDAKGKT